MIAIRASTEDESTLRYGLFDPGDDVCCPRDFADVDFYWDGMSFVAVDPIPPADPAVRGSRR